MDKARLLLWGRQGAYQRVFQGVDAETVLSDLARFCRAHESTYAGSPDASARLDGRREVWLRIQQHLRLTDEQLWQLLGEGKRP